MEQKNKTNKIIIAISAIIIFVILICGILFVVSYANKKQREQEQSSNETNQNQLNTVSDKISEDISDEKIIDNDKESFDMSNGKVDIIWIDKQNNNVSMPLKPILKNMTPIKYDNRTLRFEQVNENDDSWYDYSSKQWANAIDENQSYFVWIPRFAYKITYYADRTLSKKIGYSDARGILKINEDGSLTRVAKNNQGVKSVGNHYILHPAFMNDASNGYINGGWDNNLDGIWVAKYETSMEVNGKYMETSNMQIGDVLVSDIVKAVSKPGVGSWRNITIGKCYYNALNYNREKESHLMKNSEWGAVAYLSYSKYGTESGLTSLNSSSEYITGDHKNPNESLLYRKQESSNTNATGIFDLVGGAWEYVAGFIDNGYYRAPINAGTQPGFLFENTYSTKYKTVYSNADIDNGNGNYSSNNANANYYTNMQRRGDAIYETSTIGHGTSSWNTNTSLFMQGDVPFTLRGGDFSSGASAGIFSFNCSAGQSNASDSYRIVLTCQ